MTEPVIKNTITQYELTKKKEEEKEALKQKDPAKKVPVRCLSN